MGGRIKDKGGQDGARLKAHESSQEDPDKLPPVFSLEYLQRGFCIDSCDLQQKAQFADALWKRGKVPWSQLRAAPSHGLGYEKIKHLKTPLPHGIHQDIDIISFRCIGKAPMVGYRKKRVFYILWIDLGFNVYKHDLYSDSIRLTVVSGWAVG